MQTFNVEENLSVIMKLMMVVGTWPKDSSSISYKIRGLTTATIVTVGIALTSNSGLKFADIETASFSISCLMVTINVMVKYFFILMKRRDLFNLMEMLNRLVLSLHEDHLYAFLKKKLNMAKFYQYLFLICGIGTATLILLSPVFNRTSRRPIPLPFFVDIEERGLLVYGLVWLYECCLIILSAVNICCFDGLIFFFIAIAGGELKVLRKKIMETVNSRCALDSTKQFQDKSDETTNDLLKACIIEHIAIERFVASIQSTFSKVFLIQLIISISATCFVGFMLILVPITSFEFWVCALFFSAAMCQLGLFCVSGNEIILQSEKLRDACYMSQWVDCGPSVRKTLFIIMERSKRPLMLSAGGFVFLSLDTFISVCKSAFSYFTVLNRMYGGSMKL